MQWPILNPERYQEGYTELLMFEPRQLDFGYSYSYATLAGGGWGAGKTVGGLAYITVSAYHQPRGTAGMVVLPTHQLLDEYVETILEPALKLIIKGHSKRKKCFYLPGHRRLLYRSGHDPYRLQMSNLSYLYLDEPHLMSKEVFRHAVGRTRRKGGRMRIGLASLPKMGWLSEEFKGKDDLERRAMHWDTAGNAHNMAPDYIRNLMRACPARMQDCYLQGLFVAAGGSVYAEFNRDIHVIPWRYTPTVLDRWGQPMRTKLGVVVDWSIKRPHVLWVQRIPPGAVMPGGDHGWVTNRWIAIVVDEIFPDGEYVAVTTPRLARMIANRRTPTGDEYPIEYAVCDPAGEQRNPETGMSNVAMLEKYLGVNTLYEHGQRINVGVQHVQLSLEPMDGHPFLYFSDQLLRNQVDEFGQLEEDPRSVLCSMEGYGYGEPGVDGQLPDKPVHDDIYSHACDDVRYHQNYFFAEDRLESVVTRIN